MARKRILLIEDEAVTAMDLRSSLDDLGYEVAGVVSTGEVAIRKAAELKPDLILMDITLAGPMNGIEVAYEIRKACHTPIIFLTAHADPETIGRARATEPFGYLLKPCTRETLMSTIEIALYKDAADTERRKAEGRLRQVLHEQKIILDNIGSVILLLRDRKIIWGSRSLSRIFGYAPDDVEGKDTEILYPDRESYTRTGQAGYAALARGEVYTGEVQMKKKDGSLIWCNLVGQAVNPDNLEDGTIWLLEDISMRRKAEEELVKARNLESLGILAGGIAHDFNNLFQGLLGNISLAKHYTPKASEAFPFIEAAESVYHSVSSLTSQLIAFSKGGLRVRETIQPAGLLRSAVLLSLSGSDIRVEFGLAEDLMSVYADAEQLAQVIGNITLNARDAMPSGGTLLVSAANRNLQARDVAGLAPGRYVMISIRDTGCGIAPDILPRIFDPYFTTKEQGLQKGLGLGLAVSDAIIKKHGGLITAESEPGDGATFTVYLPADASVL